MTSDTDGKPPRTFTDPDTLRALAHPLRLRLLETLAEHGPATATELAERVGESPSNCSWHLRQLGKHGFVASGTPSGRGRQRPWRLVPWRIQLDEVTDFELARATDAANDALLNRHLAARADWQARRRLEPEHWRDLGFTSQSIFWLTADEAAALKRDLEELVECYFKLTVDRYDNPEARPEGSRPVRFVAWSAPGPEPTASRTDTQEGGDA